MLAFDRVEPIGEARGDLRNALLCQLVAGIFGGKQDVDEFMITSLLDRFSEKDEDTINTNIDAVENYLKKRYGNNS